MNAVTLNKFFLRKRKFIIQFFKINFSGMDKQTTSLKIKMQDSPRTISQKMEVPAQQTKTTINNSSANVKQIFHCFV